MVLAQPQHTYMPPIFCTFFKGGVFRTQFPPSWYPVGTITSGSPDGTMGVARWGGRRVGGEGQDQGALAPREGEPGADNECTNSVAVFLCSAFANTS